MSRVLMAATLGLGMICSGMALAQSSMTAPDNSSTNAVNPSATQPANQPGMAATSSDSGKLGTGASSAAIATGPTDKTGVMSPQAPAADGKSTGANPNSPAGVNNNQ
jgi:hypothetical protein